MIKILKIGEKRGNFFSLIKSICEIPTVDLKTKHSSSKVRNKARMSALTNLIQYSARSSGQCNKARKEKKSH